MKKFEEMNLKPELVDSLKKIGFTSPTEVQEKIIPELLSGKNVIVRAKTGTGKTGAFILPIMQMLKRTGDCEALIIVPTRELALQVTKFAQEVGDPLRVNTTTVYGGASINMQIRELRSGTDIVVGTPGRLIDLFNRGALRLDRVKFLVLDEADIMLDMGFIEDVEFLLSNTPNNRQMMLFSATMPSAITKVVDRFVQGNTLRVNIGEEESLTVNTIKQLYSIIPRNLLFSGLLAYIKEYSPKKAIIFARTKYEANTLQRVLASQKYKVILLHGGLTQSARERSLGEFRNGAQFLIATNIASRGLDIFGITDIINFGAPDDVRVYVHRVGRSARMGKEGRAVTLLDPSQKRELSDIEDYANVRMSEIRLNLEPFKNIPLPIRQGNDKFKRSGFDRNSHFRREGAGHNSFRRFNRR